MEPHVPANEPEPSLIYLRVVSLQKSHDGDHRTVSPAETYRDAAQLASPAKRSPRPPAYRDAAQLASPAQRSPRPPAYRDAAQLASQPNDRPGRRPIVALHSWQPGRLTPPHILLAGLTAQALAGQSRLYRI